MPKIYLGTMKTCEKIGYVISQEYLAGEFSHKHLCNNFRIGMWCKLISKKNVDITVTLPYVAVADFWPSHRVTGLDQGWACESHVQP